MSNWKDKYNYRRIKDENGRVIKNVIIDNKQIEVNDEIYEAYSQMHRREMYQEQKRREDISLDYLMECGVPINENCMLSPEEILLDEMRKREQKHKICNLHKAIGALDADEKKLIGMLYFKQKTERTAAEYFHISQPAIHKRKIRILKKLQKLLES